MFLGIEEGTEAAKLGHIQGPNLVTTVGGENATDAAASIGQQEKGKKVKITGRGGGGDWMMS
jgi:hypothetical protein